MADLSRMPAGSNFPESSRWRTHAFGLEEAITTSLANYRNAAKAAAGPGWMDFRTRPPLGQSELHNTLTLVPPPFGEEEAGYMIIIGRCLSANCGRQARAAGTSITRPRGQISQAAAPDRADLPSAGSRQPVIT